MSAYNCSYLLSSRFREMVDHNRSGGLLSLPIMERTVMACNNPLGWNSNVMTVFSALVRSRVSKCIETVGLNFLQWTVVRFPANHILKFCPPLNHC